ncbi:MAG: FAD-dependent monooxygenase [Xanthobacteraceae bacterium]
MLAPGWSGTTSVIVVGAGIGGLTAALALAQRGIRVSVIEQAPRLDPAGAGVQLSPNAVRVLDALGLRERLAPHVTAPAELRVLDGRSGRGLAGAVLGRAVEERYGAPYWVIHRADLQGTLLEAARANPEVSLRLGTRVEGFAPHGQGVTVTALSGGGRVEERGAALIGADGLWSHLRGCLGHGDEPRFAQHTAWRALVSADAAITELSQAALNLWLGRDAHVVHYPVRGGRLINIVAIVRDNWRNPGWTSRGDRTEILAHFPKGTWAPELRAILGAAEHWEKWALYDRPPLRRWGNGGPVTLLGDAAHPMLPYLAQGAAMAIEDASVLAECFASTADDLVGAMRSYEQQRRPRTARVQRAARRNAVLYHMGGIPAVLRGVALGLMGRQRLITIYDWLYGWKQR